ncbi:MAG: M17 family peptidase N-terminal domain-containing protein, partial [Legionellales bacterium]
MDFLVKNTTAYSEQTDALVLPVFTNGDKLDNPFLSKIQKTGDMTGKFKQTLLLHDVPGIKAKRVLLLGCGKKDELTETKYQDLINCMTTTLQQTATQTVVCLLPSVACKNRSLAWKIRHVIIHASAALYQFTQFKSKKDAPENSLKSMTFLADKSAAVTAAIKEGMAIARAMNVARDLENTPANICTPKYIAKAATAWAKKHKAVKCTVLGEKEMAKLGMGAILAVGRGSENESQLIVLEYNGGKKRK